MKLLKTLSIIVLFLPLLFSCSKNSDGPSAVETMQGKWIGTYGFDNETPTHYFSLNIKPGGIIQELNNSGVAKGQGNWTPQGKVIKGNYKMLFSPYNEYSVSVSLDANGQMTGTWGYDNDPSDGGKLILSKAN